MDWLMVIVFVVSWLFAAVALFSAVAVLLLDSVPEAEYLPYGPPFAIGVVLLLLFVWTGILRPEDAVTGLTLFPLGAGALISFGLAATIGFFNQPKLLVPKKSRDQPSVFQDWLERRRRHRAKVGARGRVIVPHRLVVRLETTARRTWVTMPGQLFRALSFEAPSLEALEAELIRRCQEYFQNPSPPRWTPQLVCDWWDESWHDMANPGHGATPHVHLGLHVVEVKIEPALEGGYVARSAEPALTVEAPSLDRLVPLVRSSLLHAHEPRGHKRFDHLRFSYVREIAAEGFQAQ
jgi:hypothetical protein